MSVSWERGKIMSHLPIINDEQENLIHEDFDGERRRRPGGAKCPNCCFHVSITSFCFITAILAVLAVIIGVSYTPIITREVSEFIAEQVYLTNGSQGVTQWANPPAKILMNFYMFNLTNKDDFLKGSKPVFEQIGPYSYIKNQTKYGFQWNEEETILSYNESTSYTLNPDIKSNPMDNVTTLNIPLIGILVQFEKLMEMIKSLPDIVQLPLKEVIEGLEESIRKEFNEGLIMTRPVDEVLWGYNDSFLAFIRDFNISFINDQIPPGGLFQLEHKESIASPNMVYTGRGANNLTARYLMYNGKTSINEWGTPFAAMINGTQGTLFHPGVDTSETLYVYVDELFRSGYFEYNKTIIEDGVTLYKFILPPSELHKETQDKGFNLYGPNGVLNLTAVFPLNVPVFVSKPMFLDGEPVYRQNVSIPPPNASIHDSFLCVEPVRHSL
jgi:lysosome membrane protein 2